jgi:hypothetical protein
MRRKLAYVLVLILTLNMILVINSYGLSDKVKAATFDDINLDSLFVKQQDAVTCTLACSVMLLRRVAIMTNSDWSSITEESIKSTAWSKGLKGSFTYNGVTITSAQFGSNPEEELKKLLIDHPEGIIIYDKYPTNTQHAILVTDYTNDTFYCADPGTNPKIPRGRIPISSSNVKIANCEKYWYVSSPDVYLIGGPTAPSITNAVVTGISSNGYTVTCNVSDDLGVTSVKFPTWTANNDQDDIVWYDGTLNGNTAIINIQTSNHKNEKGTYITHIYAYDASGNYSSTGVTAEIPKENSSLPTITPTVTPIITPVITPEPAEQKLPLVTEPEETSEDGSILVSIISSPGDLQNLIDTDLVYSSQDVFNEKESKSTVYKLVVKEEGWLFLHAYHNNKGYYDINLYSNKSLTSKIDSEYLGFNSNTILEAYLEPGDYYYQIDGNNTWGIKDTVTCYAGLMPSYSRINVANITYSKDKSKAVIQLDVDEDYYKPSSGDTIRIVKGNVDYMDLKNYTKWETAKGDNL